MKKSPAAAAPILHRPEIWLVLIFILGAALRLFNLGHDSLWLDEAGVAYAARSETVAGVLEVVRSHVMAMPLDYLVVWLFGKISLSEAVLRLPAALWGCLSLLLAYSLYRRWTTAAPALFGVLVLALSPLHIQYSQELRFYSSLVFFYLLSTLTVWDALQKPSVRRWALAAAATIIGIYFHPYVMLALANGLVWLALTPQKGEHARKLRTGFLFCATLCLLTFLTGYLNFSASNTFDIPLMVFEQSPLAALAAGLGWLPFSAPPPGLSWVWGLLCAGLEFYGVVILLRQGLRSPLAGLFYSLVLQFVLVIASDLMGHYFFAPRQWLMLLPALSLFAGIGVHQAAQAFGGLLAQRGLKSAQVAAAALAAVVLLAASAPAIQLYASDDKGDTRAISQMIINEWQPDDSVLVIPAYDGFVYKYYIEYAYQRADIANRLWVADWEAVPDINEMTGAIFVITPASLSTQEVDQLREVGLSQRFTSLPSSRYAKTLWVREASDAP